MKLRLTILGLTVFAFAPVFAQEPVLGVADPEALFHDKDPKLNANKQVAYHIMLDLLECNHWNEADKWLTTEYHQHNPMAGSGLVAQHAAPLGSAARIPPGGISTSASTV